MPTYQYACTECGHQLEAVQSFTDEPLTACPACEGRLRKMFNSVGIVFKGSGFYRTDSRATDSADGPGGAAAAKSDSSTSDSAKGGSGGDSAATGGGTSSSTSGGEGSASTTGSAGTKGSGSKPKATSSSSSTT